MMIIARDIAKAMMIKPSTLVTICTLAIAVQLCFLLFNPRATLISNASIALCALLACIGCLQEAYLRSEESGRLWVLLGSGLFISFMGQSISTGHEFMTHTRIQNEAIGADFLFFVYGIPILLAICSDGRDRSIRVLLWLEGGQAILLAILAYVQLFSALPYLERSASISAVDLLHLNNAENLTLAGAVSFRLRFVSSRADRRFYQSLAVYLWCYLLVALIVGQLELGKGVPDGLQDVAWGLPYLGLLLYVVRGKYTRDRDDHISSEETHAARAVIENVAPLLFTFLVVVMAVRVSPSHAALAYSCVVSTLTLYGTRTTLLQRGYLRSQEELTKTAFALVEANDHLSQLAGTDALTGVSNRRTFDETLGREWNRAARNGQPLSLVMLDVDCFKALNDFYGHHEGDRCLRSIAQEAQKRLRRPTDLLARFGGEEFAVILPETTSNAALVVADDIRRSVEVLGLPNERSTCERFVTVSIGIATAYPYQGGSCMELLESADVAMYRAKEEGKNHCIVFSEIMPSLKRKGRLSESTHHQE